MTTAAVRALKGAGSLIGDARMAFLDRFRTKPEWQNTDPNVRLAAVKRLDAEDHELLSEIARRDPDPAVRLAALRKSSDPALIVDAAQNDPDEGLRNDAAEMLVAVAVQDTEGTAGGTALTGLRDMRHLVMVAREARLESIGCAAVARVFDQKALASLARNAESAAIRLEATRAITEPAHLAELALKCEHKEVAVAAVDRIDDRATLESVEARARHKGASRRAQAILAAMAPPEHVPVPAPEPKTPAPDPAKALEALIAAASAGKPVDVIPSAVPPVPSNSVHTALCERMESLSVSGTRKEIEEAKAEWEGLERLAGQDDSAITARFERAAAEALKRVQAEESSRERRAHLEDLCTRVEQTVDEADLETAVRQWQRLAERWKDASVPAPPPDDLVSRFAKAAARMKEREEGVYQERMRQQSENLARQIALCDQVEAAGASTDVSLKEVDRLFREAKAAIENLGPLPSRRDRDLLTARLEKGRSALYTRLQELRQDEEWKRWANMGIQEELCGAVEALLEVEDLGEAARRLREIEEQWRQASQVRRGEGDALWHRFVAARDQIRNRTSAHFSKVASEMAENSRKKEELCQRAEAMADSTDWIATAEALKALQEEWRTIGPVPRSQSKVLWERFRSACDRFFTRRKEDRTHRAKEQSVNLASKIALCERAEALSESLEWEKAAAEIRRLQAEWKTVGPVRKNKSDAVWERFRKACDRFYDRYKHRDDVELESFRAKVDESLGWLESCLPAVESPEPAAAPPDLLDKVRAAQILIRQADHLPRDQAAALATRCEQVKGRLLAAFPKSFEGTDLDPGALRKKMESLCFRVEKIVQEFEPVGTEEGEADLANLLRQALAANALGGRAVAVSKWQAAKETVESTHASWKRLPAGAAETNHDLSDRFHRAHARFFELRPRGDPSR